MLERRLKNNIISACKHYPAVVLLGPRQVGKTTLARTIAAEQPSLYIDLESEHDRAMLSNPESYFRTNANKLIILDEVHRMPELFRVLRSAIDADLPAPRRNGRFLLLGSASLDLLKHADESLAGRVAHLELPPLDALEVAYDALDTLWLRGGFPASFLSDSDRTSLEQRHDLIRAYLERDVPQYGIRIPAETLRRLFTMLAHTPGGLLNAATLARALAVDGKTIAHHIDLLVDLLLVRCLSPWHTNTKKRLIKSPKVYIRDTGIIHALLGISDMNTLLGHPVFGMSWESFVVEQLSNALPRTSAPPSFYRTATGDELDMVFDLAPGMRFAVEIKASEAPHHTAGFMRAAEAVGATHRFVVYRGTQRYPMHEGVEAIGVIELMEEIIRRTNSR